MVREEAVLAALRRRALWQRYRSVLKAGHFSDTANRRLFAYLDSAHRRGSAEEIPAEALQMDLPAIPEDFEAQLEDFAVRAQLADLATGAHHQLNQTGLLTSRELAEVVGKAQGLEGLAGADVLDRIVGRNGKGQIRQRYPTGLAFLDQALSGGLAPGELFMFGAPPYGGKTHWLVKLGTGYAAQGCPVYHFSLEDRDADVLDYYKTAIRQLPKAQQDVAYEALTILDYSDQAMSVGALDEAVKTLVGRKRPQDPIVLVVDYGDLIRASSSRGEDAKRDRIAESYEAQRRLANRFNAIYLTGTQTTVHGWKRKFLDMENLADAKIGKAKVADVIVMVSQVPVEKLSGTGRLIVTKARGRRVVDPTLDFRADWSTFEVQGEQRT